MAAEDCPNGRGHIDNYFTAEGIVSALLRDCRLQTHVERKGVPIYLEPGDEVCTDCGEQIPTDAFGDAPYGRVLAGMKSVTGETYCAGCYDHVYDKTNEN